MQEIFRFAPPSGYQLLLSVAAAALGLTWLELYKWLRPYADARARSFRARITELTMPTPESVHVIDSASRRER
jgi:hypothetical protein